MTGSPSDIPDATKRSRWIPADKNPFGVAVLDISYFASTMGSTTFDPRCEQNALSYGLEDGSSFVGEKPDEDFTHPISLSFRIGEDFQDGALFRPNEMEQKWAIFHHQNKMFFVRSWKREVAVIAKTRQEGGCLYLESLHGDFTGDEDPVLNERIADFLLKSHVLHLQIPAPILESAIDDISKVTTWCFGLFGRLAVCACAADLRELKVEQELRSDSKLHFAAAEGNIEAARKHIRDGVSPNCRGSHGGMTPLHVAAELGQTEFLEFLLDNGGDIDSENDSQLSVLASAARGASEGRATVDLLLSRGARHLSGTADGTLPLHWATQAGNTDKMRALIDAGTPADVADSRGFTSLHRSAELGHLAATELLLQHRADPNNNVQGHTPKTVAEAREQKDILALFELHEG